MTVLSWTLDGRGIRPVCVRGEQERCLESGWLRVSKSFTTVKTRFSARSFPIGEGPLACAIRQRHLRAITETPLCAVNTASV